MRQDAAVIPTPTVLRRLRSSENLVEEYCLLEPIFFKGSSWIEGNIMPFSALV